MNLQRNFSKENFHLKTWLLAALLILSSCRSSLVHPDSISSINIIDRNGITETISEKERLKPFQKTDFLTPQPYQKVLRVYGRDEKGDSRSCITSYHPNGQIKQYLEAVNNRAFGSYKEWHPNGQLKIESRVIGGVADINTQAEESWLFDGTSQAWDEEGHLLATISYSKGELEGLSTYYHTNGALWKTIPFVKNVPHGTEKIYLVDGALLQTTEYRAGKKEGKSLRYWESEQIASSERYEQGLLLEGSYFSKEGELVSEIYEGCGFRALFGKQVVHELHEYQEGIQQGLVKQFDKAGRLTTTYCLKNGEKEGQEFIYYPSGKTKLLVTWKEGQIQGVVKTWYENGSLESQKEMSQNKKNGVTTAWYPNGFLMLVEDYDNDRLLKGEYYRAGEKTAVSTINLGEGVATLFESNGTFKHKITYHEGRPA